MTEANCVVITNDDGELTIAPLTRENFHKEKNGIIVLSSKNILSKSPYVDKELSSTASEDNVIFFYRHNKYIYLENEKRFLSLRSNLTLYTNSEIHTNFKSGIHKLVDYNYQLNKFDFNSINLKARSFIYLLMLQLLHPFYAYQLVTVAIWIKTEYTEFLAIILFFFVISVLMNTYQNYINHNMVIRLNILQQCNIVRILDETNDKFFLNRKLDSLKNSSEYIVPGDIIELRENETAPCDCILLEGFCTVNESDLTGESNVVIKMPLPNDNTVFKFDSKNNSLIFSGTKIDKIEYFNGKLVALVVNTGFNTIRGNLIQSILFPKTTNFKFYRDIFLFLIPMLLIYITNLIFIKKISAGKEHAGQDLIDKALDTLTIVFPPILPLTMSFTSFYYHYNLNKKNISCINDTRLNAAGLVNIIVFDKTGTLTEEGLDLVGFQTTRITNKGLETCVEMDEAETSGKIYNAVHKELWKEICNSKSAFGDMANPEYLYDYRYNIVYFTECLACCHTVDKLKENSFGDTIDLKILESIKWHQIRSNLDNQNDINTFRYSMIPRNAHFINEHLIINGTKNNFFADKKFSITIIKRFQFYSIYQSMSVIVKNNFDNRHRYFIKGAPEKIHLLCKADSIPIDYDKVLSEHTNKGYRILACASKFLPNGDYEKENERNKFDSELTFLGFIIFRNKLKRDTRTVVSKLVENNCKLVMSTGDNPYTSISIGKEANFFDQSCLVYLIDYDDNKFKL
jgi:cation-transporting ATPase 13A2